jgi:hypothetical protein
LPSIDLPVVDRQVIETPPVRLFWPRRHTPFYESHFMADFFSLAEAAAKFAQFEVNMRLANEAILSEWAALVRDRAKKVIGSYKYRWPQLADATKADRVNQGFPENEPLLRTGEMRDSIQAHVEMFGPEHGRAVVGSNNDKAAWQELGTSRIPPRSFLMESAKRAGEREITRIARKYIRSAWTSAGHSNEILQLLHAIRLLLETTMKIYERTAHQMRETR